MNQISMFCIGFSGICLIVAAVLFALSRRRHDAKTYSDRERDRAVTDDQNDRIVWEFGQGFPLVDKDEDANAKVMPRRAFFSRAALGFLGVFVSWRMARGSTNTRFLNKMSEIVGSGAHNPQKGLDSNRLGTPTGQQNELAFMQGQDHQDSHYDSHMDIDAHNDNMISHQDMTNARGVHYDVPHVDYENHGDSGHTDTHTDS
jgi:hypothetical protein